ncbi:hypothetical protein JCM14469_37230 [Desulfatiferula olefinivorans]
MTRCFLFVTLMFTSLTVAAQAVQIAPSPLTGPTFAKGVHTGRGELVYINYDDVYGGGIQGVKRFALSDRVALSPSVGAYHLTGDQAYTDPVMGGVTMDMDYTFAAGGLRGEVQHRIGALNLIIFGGGLFHYGESESDLSVAGVPGSDRVESTDKGLGWEAGAQAAVALGTVTAIVFFRHESLRVTTDNEDEPGATITSDPEQTVTFDSNTLGVDVLFKNGISLSGLLSIPDDSDEENVTMIKLGFPF